MKTTSKGPTPAEMKRFLKRTGWGTWYNENYWVHPKTVADRKTQDHTNYGMPLELAYQFETNAWPPFRPLIGLPAASMANHAQFRKAARLYAAQAKRKAKR